MELKKTVRFTLILYIVGALLFFVFGGLDRGLWFGIGGGLALLNVFFALWTIRFGFKSTKNKGLFLGLLIMKSMTFLMVVLILLMFLKPVLLPFTMGISLVIFGAVAAALVESKSLLKGS